MLKQTELTLTHWGRVTHICVGKLSIIGSDNGLWPSRRQAIIWTNAGILLIGTLGTNFSEISIEIYTFSFKKMHLKMPSGKWRPCCLGLSVLRCGSTFKSFVFKLNMQNSVLWIHCEIALISMPLNFTNGRSILVHGWWHQAISLANVDLNLYHFFTSIDHNELIQCGLVMPYGNIDLAQHRLEVIDLGTTSYE